MCESKVKGLNTVNCPWTKHVKCVLHIWLLQVQTLVLSTNQGSSASHFYCLFMTWAGIEPQSSTHRADTELDWTEISVFMHYTLSLYLLFVCFTIHCLIFVKHCYFFFWKKMNFTSEDWIGDSLQNWVNNLNVFRIKVSVMGDGAGRWCPLYFIFSV